MARLRQPFPPNVADLLEGCCLRNETAEFTAQAIFDATGQRIAVRTIGRRMHEWRQQQGRIRLLQDLGLGASAVPSERQLTQPLGSPFAKGKYPPVADDLVRALQSFVRRPSPSAMAEVVLACLAYQVKVAFVKRAE